MIDFYAEIQIFFGTVRDFFIFKHPDPNHFTRSDHWFVKIFVVLKVKENHETL